MDCTVGLTDISANSADEKMVLRSRTKTVQFQLPVVPGKRNRRLMSVPVQSGTSNENIISIRSEDHEQNKDTPAKRKRRLNSTPVRSSSNEDTENSLSKLISMNCKLTNELLVLKKQYSEKNDALLKTTQCFHDTNLQYQKLQFEFAQMEKEVERLEKCVEELRAERFCNDLIDLRSNTEETTGTLKILLKYFTIRLDEVCFKLNHDSISTEFRKKQRAQRSRRYFVWYD